MKNQFAIGLLVAAGTVFAANAALAQDYGEGTMFYEIARQQATPYVASVTREQVQAELREALRDGSIISGDSGSLAALSPAWHTTPPVMLTGNAPQAPKAN